MVREIGGIYYTLNPSEIKYGHLKEKKREVSIGPLLNVVVLIENPEFTPLQRRKHHRRLYFFGEMNFKAIIGIFRNEPHLFAAFKEAAEQLDSYNAYSNSYKEHVKELFSKFIKTLSAEEQLLMEIG